jgi:hypothetical protein
MASYGIMQMKNRAVLVFSGMLAFVFLSVLGTGCRSTYYAAYEQFGVYKRDLLKKRVVAARDEQKEAGEQFKDALTRLKAITKFDGGRLEKEYKALQGEYDDCTVRADAVRQRIKDMDQVAKDLFAEWEKEIGQINTASLRESSREQLAVTRDKYQSVATALKQAEASMAPVLVQFKDYVLYLKHNLNAQAVASIKGEATNIQNDIARLIEQMNASITRADDFVKTLK